MCAIGLAAAVLIHVLYDGLLGPDPRRFSLIVNIVMDTAFVLVNTIAAAIAAWVVTVVTGRPVWRLARTAAEIG
ncbi:MAG: hypothetical protein AAF907_13890 [Planctomycetota bacterium]